MWERFVGGAALLWLGLAPLQAPRCAPAPPDAAGDEPPGWEVVLTPYVWGVSMHGEIEAQGVEADFSTGFHELLEHMNFAAMALAEVQRDRLVALVDFIYADLEDDDAGVGPLRVDATASELIFDAKLGQRVWSQGASPWVEAARRGRRRPRVVLDLLAGTRYVRFKNDIELAAAGASRNAEQSFDWVDVVFGFRASADLGRSVRLGVRADAGGFGIGSASDFTWSSLAVIHLRLAQRWALSAGYRVLYIDRRAVDLWQHGPLIGLSYAF
jgi:hypothetical protein